MEEKLSFSDLKIYFSIDKYVNFLLLFSSLSQWILAILISFSNFSAVFLFIFSNIFLILFCLIFIYWSNSLSKKLKFHPQIQEDLLTKFVYCVSILWLIFQIISICTFLVAKMTPQITRNREVIFIYFIQYIFIVSYQCILLKY